MADSPGYTLNDWVETGTNPRGLTLTHGKTRLHLYVKNDNLRLQVINDSDRTVLDVPIPFDTAIAIGGVNTDNLQSEALVEMMSRHFKGRFHYRERPLNFYRRIECGDEVFFCQIDGVAKPGWRTENYQTEISAAVVAMRQIDESIEKGGDT